jgi:hypothetical protein
MILSRVLYKEYMFYIYRTYMITLSSKTCPICDKTFSRKYNMRTHMERVHNPTHVITKVSTHVCPICDKTYTNSTYVRKHIETVHAHDQEFDEYQHVTSQIGELQKKLETCDEKQKELAITQREQEEKQRESNEIINNQIKKLEQTKEKSEQYLQIMCVGAHDNIAQMLIDQMGGDVDRAVTYIKDCALSDINGDCNMIDHIYGKSISTNTKHTYIYFYDEKHERVMETKEVFGRKIANNLQNGYLFGINHVINKGLKSRCNPNKILDDYDLVTWNAHICNLGDTSYQGKIVSRLYTSHEGRNHP